MWLLPPTIWTKRQDLITRAQITVKTAETAAEETKAKIAAETVGSKDADTETEDPADLPKKNAKHRPDSVLISATVLKIKTIDFFKKFARVRFGKEFYAGKNRISTVKPLCFSVGGKNHFLRKITETYI